jgi:hypothetical protein
VIHRDLAARNILLDDDLHAKVRRIIRLSFAFSGFVLLFSTRRLAIVVRCCCCFRLPVRLKQVFCCTSVFDIDDRSTVVAYRIAADFGMARSNTHDVDYLRFESSSFPPFYCYGRFWIYLFFSLEHK